MEKIGLVGLRRREGGAFPGPKIGTAGRPIFVMSLLFEEPGHPPFAPLGPGFLFPVPCFSAK